MMSCLRLAAPVVLAVRSGLPPARRGRAGRRRQRRPRRRSRRPIRTWKRRTPLQPGDAFGEEVTLPAAHHHLPARPQQMGQRASTRWSIPSNRSTQYLAKQGIEPNGPPMTIYVETDDTGFGFRVAVPVAQARRTRPRATSRSARRRPARRSNSCTAAPTARWTKPMRRSSIISTTRGWRPRTFSSRNIPTARSARRQAQGQCLRSGEMTMTDMPDIAILVDLARRLSPPPPLPGAGDRQARHRHRPGLDLGGARHRGDPHRRHQPGQDRARGERRQRQADDRGDERDQGSGIADARHPDLAAVAAAAIRSTRAAPTACSASR